MSPQNRLKTAPNFCSDTIRGEVTAWFINLFDKKETCFSLTVRRLIPSPPVRFVYLACKLPGLVGTVLDLSPRDKIIWDLSHFQIMSCLSS